MLKKPTVPIFYRTEYGNLVSPVPDKKEPIFNWHTFKHSFSRQLVERLANEFALKKGAWILDPFCGGGTTLLSSKLTGFNARGFDILPFSVFLSNVKSRDYDIRKLLNDLLILQASLRKKKRATAKLPKDIGLLDKAFSVEVRDELLRIKTRINEVASNVNRDFFNLAFLSILEAASNTSKAGGFLRLVDRSISHAEVIDLFHSRCANMFADVLKVAQTSSGCVGTAEANLGDARKIDTSQMFDAVITSPPYPNRHDYTRIYALEMAFDFITGNDDLKKIRYETLRSHVEARKQYDAENYEQPAELSKLIKKIERNGLNNNSVPEMISGYFEDMHICLSQMRSRLNKKGKIALVVSNVRFSGVNIPVDKILAKIGLDVGLKSAKIWTARKRGNSAQQMRDYSRIANRESIVIWTN